jgi:hypothetical protein
LAVCIATKVALADAAGVAVPGAVLAGAALPPEVGARLEAVADDALVGGAVVDEAAVLQAASASPVPRPSAQTPAVLTMRVKCR